MSLIDCASASDGTDVSCTTAAANTSPAAAPFAELGLHPELLQAIADLGYTVKIVKDNPSKDCDAKTNEKSKECDTKCTDTPKKGDKCNDK